MVDKSLVNESLTDGQVPFGCADRLRLGGAKRGSSTSGWCRRGHAKCDLAHEVRKDFRFGSGSGSGSNMLNRVLVGACRPSPRHGSDKHHRRCQNCNSENFVVRVQVTGDRYFDFPAV